MTLKQILYVLSLCTILHSPLAMAQGKWKSPSSSPGGMSDYKERVQKKEGSRWTLQEWLAQKEKNKMMDLWLGMYAPSPYETIIAINYMDYKTKSDNPVAENSYYNTNGRFAFYALILGLEAQYDYNSKEGYLDNSGQLNLRLAGNAVQGTHLILQLGQKSRKLATETILQNYTALDLDLYVESHSGLHGNYRNYSPTQDKALNTINERYWEAGYFFDVSNVRLYINYFSNISSSENSTTKINTEKVGNNAGLQFYF